MRIYNHRACLNQLSQVNCGELGEFGTMHFLVPNSITTLVMQGRQCIAHDAYTLEGHVAQYPL